MKPFSILIVPLVLSACVTAQQSCIDRETKDLRVLTALITEAEANIKRGYAIETLAALADDAPGCFPSLTEEVGADVPFSCHRQTLVEVNRPVSIDLIAEKAKLNSMRAKQSELRRSAETSLAKCRAQFPLKDQK